MGFDCQEIKLLTYLLSSWAGSFSHLLYDAFITLHNWSTS